MSVVLGLSVAPALALPPKPSVVIELARKTQPQPAWVRVTYTGGTEGRPPTLALRVLIAPDGRIRQDLQRIQGRVTASTVWAPSSVDANARSVKTAPAWLRVLAGHDLGQVLTDMQVDRGVTSYAHDKAQILWVVGAGPRDVQSPQLHVERATGTIRQITERLGEGETAQSVTVRWAEFPADTTTPAARWPTAVTITGLDATPVVLRLDKVDIGEPIANSAFASEPAPPTRDE